MKKVALSLMALSLVAAGAFADAPKWDPKVTTEIKGDATVTFGYDLDQGVYAFKNSTSVDFVIDLVSSGDRATASDADVWGEIKVITDGDPVRLKPADHTLTGYAVKVDFAKIHLGKSAYLSITSHGTQIKYASSPDLAWFGHQFDSSARYGKDKGRFIQAAFGDTGAANAGGVELGYTADKIVTVTVAFGSINEWSTATVEKGSKDPTSNKLAYKAALDVLALSDIGLTLGAGYSSSTVKESASAYGAKAAYTYKIDGDKLYLKPTVGVGVVDNAGKTVKPFNTASAGLLVGTGAKVDAFDNYGLKYGNDDYGSYPGLSAGVFYSDEGKVNKTADKAAIGLNVSANAGTLVPDLGLVASYEIKDLSAKNAASNINLGFTYSLKSGDIGIAPKGFISVYSEKDAIAATGAMKKAASSSAFAKFTVDFTGVVPFTTFTVNYESNDLSNGYGFADPDTSKPVSDKNGKVELSAKIAL
jgi:hypothetical protein